MTHTFHFFVPGFKDPCLRIRNLNPPPRTTCEHASNDDFKTPTQFPWCRYQTLFVHCQLNWALMWQNKLLLTGFIVSDPARDWRLKISAEWPDVAVTLSRLRTLDWTDDAEAQSGLTATSVEIHNPRFLYFLSTVHFKSNCTYGPYTSKTVGLLQCFSSIVPLHNTKPESWGSVFRDKKNKESCNRWPGHSHNVIKSVRDYVRQKTVLSLLFAGVNFLNHPLHLTLVVYSRTDTSHISFTHKLTRCADRRCVKEHFSS